MGTCQRWRGTVADGRQRNAVVALLQTGNAGVATQLEVLELVLLFSSGRLKPGKRQPWLCSNPVCDHTWPGDVPVAQKTVRCFPCHVHLEKQPSPPQLGALGQVNSVRQVPGVSNRDAYTQN